MKDNQCVFVIEEMIVFLLHKIEHNKPGRFFLQGINLSSKKNTSSRKKSVPGKKGKSGDKNTHPGANQWKQTETVRIGP